MSYFTDLRDQVEVGLHISTPQDAAKTGGSLIRQATAANGSAGTPTAAPVANSFAGGTGILPHALPKTIGGVSVVMLAGIALAAFALVKLVRR